MIVRPLKSAKSDLFHLLLLLFLFTGPLLLISACSDRRDQTYESFMDEGTVVVLNTTLEVDVPPWQWTSEHVAGVAYGDTSYMFRDTYAVTVLENGTWVVLDSMPMELRIYDRSGRHLRSFGRPGGGPSDLRWDRITGQLKGIGSDRFELWYGWPIRIQTWNTEGDLLEVRSMAIEHPLTTGRYPRTVGTIGSKVFALVPSWIRENPDEAIHFSHLIAGDWQGSGVDTLYTIEHTPMSNWTGMSQAAFDYPAFDLMLITSTERLYISSWEEDWIHEIDPESGDEIRRFRLEHEPMAIPDHKVEEFRRVMGNRFTEGLVWLQERTWFLAMYEGPEGEIWVRRTGEPALDGTWPTDIFSSEGIFLGRMHLQHLPLGSGIFHGTDLHAVGLIEDDAPALMKYEFRRNR
ncbi:hypothetical protein ACFL41_00620 [Gemmatimonadota bacterium]